MVRMKKLPLRRHSPHWLHGDWEAPSAAASRTPSKGRNEAVILDEEGRVKPTTSEDSGVTLLPGLLHKLFS